MAVATSPDTACRHPASARHDRPSGQRSHRRRRGPGQDLVRGHPLLDAPGSPRCTSPTGRQSAPVSGALHRPVGRLLLCAADASDLHPVRDARHRHNEDLIVLDDGAYFLRALSVLKAISNHAAHAFDGARMVEQTTRGHEFVSSHSRELQQLGIRVASIARARTKLEFEAPFVGASVATALASKAAQLRPDGIEHLAVLGHGAIGEACAHQLRQAFPDARPDGGRWRRGATTESQGRLRQADGRADIGDDTTVASRQTATLRPRRRMHGPELLHSRGPTPPRTQRRPCQRLLGSGRVRPGRIRRPRRLPGERRDRGSQPEGSHRYPRRHHPALRAGHPGHVRERGLSRELQRPSRMPSRRSHPAHQVPDVRRGAPGQHPAGSGRSPWARQQTTGSTEKVSPVWRDELSSGQQQRVEPAADDEQPDQAHRRRGRRPRQPRPRSARRW